ncbi:MAG TPA: TIGR03087 family PEP-CTERM/XrtA system glycosyltransferase [Allosphingosinicella sp.]
MADILFLAHRIPYPPNRGDKIRSWNMLKHLAGLARVHLVCFADDEEDAAHLAALKAELGAGLGETYVEIRRANKFAAAAQAMRAERPISLVLFDSREMRAFVRALLARGEVGAIFAFSGQMAQFVPQAARQRFVMDFVDMDSAKFADYAAEGPEAMRWVHAREADKLFSFERATAGRADVSLFVSGDEAALFKSQAALPNADIRVVQNGIDLGFYDPHACFDRLGPTERGEGPLIVFTGQMDYRPNVEAVTAFAEEVMPLVRAERPSARFAIVGRNPTSAVTRLGDLDGIVVTGGVADVRSWLAAADAVAAPLRIARGIQNKVLEAMAMARPVVASAAAFRGIEAQPGRDLIVADSAHEQARAVLDLLDDPIHAEAVGAAARRQMESVYRWEAQLAPLAAILGLAERQAAA